MGTSTRWSRRFVRAGSAPTDPVVQLGGLRTAARRSRTVDPATHDDQNEGMHDGLVKSRVRWRPHARFEERTGESGRSKPAPCSGATSLQAWGRCVGEEGSVRAGQSGGGALRLGPYDAESLVDTGRPRSLRAAAGQSRHGMGLAFKILFFDVMDLRLGGSRGIPTSGPSDRTDRQLARERQTCSPARIMRKATLLTDARATASGVACSSHRRAVSINTGSGWTR
jgi:hypothetical protein